MSILPYDEDHGQGHYSGPAWPFEPLGSEIETGLARHGADTRPEFSAELLTAEVVRVLREYKVDINPQENQMYTAAVAAAQMLRALGVRATAPERRR